MNTRKSISVHVTALALAAALAAVAAPAHAADDREYRPGWRKEATNLAKTAVGLQSIGRYTEAVEAYKKLLEISKENAAIRYNMGTAYYSAGMKEDAVRELTRALEIDPKYQKAHANLALALADLGRDEEALAEYEKALKGKKSSPSVRMKLGVFYDKRGKYDLAKAEFEKAIASDPDHAPSHYYYAKTLYNTGEYEKAWQEVHAAGTIDRTLLEKEFLDALGQKLPDPDPLPAPKPQVQGPPEGGIPTS